MAQVMTLIETTLDIFAKLALLNIEPKNSGH